MAGRTHQAPVRADDAAERDSDLHRAARDAAAADPRAGASAEPCFSISKSSFLTCHSNTLSCQKVQYAQPADERLGPLYLNAPQPAALS